ncbi:PREDICTED: transcriptional activator DEMETER-like isoform X2 [Ipomoea nil]|uniref:transcriptional activator DEMETER-like isoform X2 n=1 Tax=Ipomoea nil TaxID=35883 RepID=UPI000901A492|nr:PREDICTED: transcriptional activator DEMETER-like isoform X2 [Ipomoea nil]
MSMNLGRRFSVPQENGDPWIPVIPQITDLSRPTLVPADLQGNQILPRHDLIPSGMQGNQTEMTNWQELVGIYGELLQEGDDTGAIQNVRSVEQMDGNSMALMNLKQKELHTWQNGVVQNQSIDQSMVSYGKNLGHLNPGWSNCSSLAKSMATRNTPIACSMNASPEKSIPATSKPDIPSSYPQLEGNYTHGESSSPMPPKQKLVLHSSAVSSSYTRKRQSHDGFAVPYTANGDIYSPSPETVVTSGAASFVKFAPITPDKADQLKICHHSEIQNFSSEENSSPEKDNQEQTTWAIREGDNHSVYLIQNTPDSLSAAISPLSKGNNTDSKGNAEIDLNKTPQPKPPRRPKHRPKVVVEGKPKRTSKSSAPKNSTPNENPSGKRKRVRRKPPKTPSSKQDDEMNGVATSNADKVKSCRRVLNFDVENGAANGKQGRDEGSQVEARGRFDQSFNLNLGARDKLVSLVKDVSTTSMMQEQQNGEQQLVTTSSRFQKPINVPTSPATPKSHKLNAIARNLNVRNTILYQNSRQNGYNQVEEVDHEKGISRNDFQTNTSQARIEETRQLALQSTSQMLRDIAKMTGNRGFKRDLHSSELTDSQAVNLVGSHLLCHNMSRTGKLNSDCSTLGICSTTRKKKKSKDSFCGTITSTPSYVTAVKDCSAHMQTGSSISPDNSRLSNPNLHREIKCQNAENVMSGDAANRHLNPLTVGLHYQGQHTLSQLHPNAEKQCTPSYFQSNAGIEAENMSQQHTETDGHKALATVRNWNTKCATVSVSESVQGHEKRTSPATISAKATEVRQASPNQASRSSRKQIPREKKNAQGPLESGDYTVTVDILALRLECLAISDKRNNLDIEDQGALVPYKGDGALVPYKGDGALVPYEGYDLSKSRKPRPKVDLDPETNRLWNLLMGKEGSECKESMDKDKAKWWEDEREVFQGRADSFIARMHLVQGDRRFSRWKGSVVDSVIGVFLTQNVSDHLSSSAFISLVAKFPQQSVIKETEVQVIDPDGTISYHKSILKQPGHNHSSAASGEASDLIMKNLTRAREIHIPNEKNRRMEEEVISLQNSSVSFILQANEEIKSSTGSNSEAEDRLSGSSPKNGQNQPEFSLQTEVTASFQEFQHYAMYSALLNKKTMPRNQQSKNPVSSRENGTLDRGSTEFDFPINSNNQCIENSAFTFSDPWLLIKEYSDTQETTSDYVWKENASSLHSVANGTNQEKSAYYCCTGVEYIAQNTSTSTSKETEATIVQASGVDQDAFLKKKSEHLVNLQPHPQTGHIQHFASSDQQERSKISQLDNTFKASSDTAKAHAKQQSEGEIHPDKLATENAINVSNAKKRKTEKENNKVDWDSLRKQVQYKSEKIGRSKDTMDSLDYEALRRAEVKDISAVIKGRGMNNMLAERIKDFLNRLVRDHGSIDLEWLRHAPPDKVKEYLLSIRGLGLKSVECVRLLTLHHLAFPVDTNVGRIAVRLGWVPLQPLPESLQLHLLEMYPVLESIQKYLWPRLCKLDQKTLYELHYQMITFGKVFCTKSKPNCNACPMRGECRHFASAFASARLALPGPEERSMVNSGAPISADGNPAASFKSMPLLLGKPGDRTVSSADAFEASYMSSLLNKPMPLPPEITSLNREATEFITSSYEPIIEEPATPEPMPEVSESDIEDAFYEDPDEIPTIELNIKEFTANLQTILQEQSMGIQEGDMSTALVALNPEAASIPTPKLKNVSRLRTEHQVYELPDSHSLLERMDRREPDDPSPYLLAIWTPGETANSVQPPETNCDYQASGRLCNENTCYSCNNVREADSQTIRGTLLIPCRTAMRGSFPLNGTYFQVNEVFADHESSLNPIDVPRRLIWYLPRRTVYFGTSVSTIFKGLSTDQIQHCFWRGFVCVRGFDQKTRAPRPLIARLHFPASRLAKNKNENGRKQASAAK